MSIHLALVRTVLIAVAISVTLASADADARRRKRQRRPSGPKKVVVILPFKGPGAPAVQARLVRRIKPRVRLLPYKTYRRTAAKLKVDPTSADGVVAVCSKMRCDAVLTGQVTRRGSRFIATIRVLDGSTGDELGTPRVTIRGRRRLPTAGTRLGAPALAYVGQGSAPARDVPPPEPPPESDVVPDEPVAPPDEVPPLLAAEDPEGLGPKPADDDERVLAYGGLFQVHAALGASTRTFELKGADAAEDRIYDGGLFPEITLGAELYPLAFFFGNFAKNFGLALNYARHIAVSTDLPDNPNRPATCNFSEQVDTGSQQLIADLKVRWPIPGAWGPIVQGVAGFGFREFHLGPNDVLPTFNWQFVRLGASGRVPLGTPLIGVEAGFDVRMLLKVGQEAVDALGERSGGMGWSAYAGLRGDLNFGLFYFATLEYQRYSSDFKGFSTQNMIRPCFPDRADATSGTDSYLRFWGGVGYAM